ncbi:glycosyltransferase family A protein [uncultured Draconibacterium sp.]|uniref:glycosyltransferase family 2 protein n=1 Tax=uncultured Draconibacterium sp. TaxID=1573823 RepID=UPI0025E0F0F4|nr:glycosyltransferase family A protein [uncultured Draconibacterium sp.]
MHIPPLISVIVPCYNQGEYLDECLESIHSQSYNNYEIIVINDGSTDELTNKIISKISHPKIKVLQTTNQGVSSARNHAINVSSGKYLLPLDADDKIGVDFIQKAVEILEKDDDIKVVNCDTKLFGIKNGIVRYEAYSLEKLLAKNMMTVSSVYRRSDFDRTNGYNTNMKDGFEDWDFWLSLLKNGGKVHKINSVGFYYRIKRKSRNSQLNAHFKKLRRQIYKNHKELYAKHLLDPQESFEYELITQSHEYKLGVFLLKPIRTIYRLFH